MIYFILPKVSVNGIMLYIFFCLALTPLRSASVLYGVEFEFQYLNISQFIHSTVNGQVIRLLPQCCCEPACKHFLVIMQEFLDQSYMHLHLTSGLVF